MNKEEQKKMPKIQNSNNIIKVQAVSFPAKKVTKHRSTAVKTTAIYSLNLDV